MVASGRAARNSRSEFRNILAGFMRRGLLTDADAETAPPGLTSHPSAGKTVADVPLTGLSLLIRARAAVCRYSSTVASGTTL